MPVLFFHLIYYGEPLTGKYVQYSEKHNADILLGTDPDTERVGVVVRNNEGNLIHLLPISRPFIRLQLFIALWHRLLMYPVFSFPELNNVIIRHKLDFWLILYSWDEGRVNR